MGIWHNGENEGGPALVAATVQKANGTVVDVTTDILHPGADITIQQAGRQTELARVEAGQADLVLENAAGTYTPGAVAAPTSLALGMPFHWKETVGRRSFDLFDGALNQPEASFENLAGNVGDQVAVTAVDWMGQQQQGRQFISNLAEHIIYTGGATLRAYYPMTETAKPFLPAVNTATLPQLSTRVFGSSAQPPNGETNIIAGQGVMPIGEDAKIAAVTGPLDATGLPALAYHVGYNANVNGRPATITFNPGQVLTIVVWVNPVVFAGATQTLLSADMSESVGGLTDSFTLFKNPTTGQLSVSTSFGSLTGTIVGRGMPSGRPYPIAIRYGYTPTVFELWVDRARYTGTMAGSAPASFTYLINATSNVNFQGSWGHLQVYVGDAADFTFDQYLGQIRYANNAMTGGLRWQRTDERIRTLAQYAGLSASQLNLDRGSAYMPRASLAGKTFATAAAEAVDTEQGRLFVAGNGSLRFHSRATTRYDL